MTPQANPSRWHWHAGAFLIYAAISIVFIDHGLSLTRIILGAGEDPFQYVWFFKWWPWAAMHGLNPLYTDKVWQPLGVPMVWVTSVPLLSWLAAPLTLIGQPVLAYNLLLLASPVFAAFAAYGLCFYLTRSYAGASIGGFIFGFSGYEIAADTADLNLAFIALVPCVAWVSLARFDGTLNRRSAILLASLLISMQFLVSVEIFATTLFFGIIAWLLAFTLFAQIRPRLRRFFLDALMTGAVVLFVISPFLLSMMRHPHYLKLPEIWPYFFVADVFNFFVPNQLDLLGQGLLERINHNFTLDPQERDAYLGLPLIVILALFIRQEWRTPAGRFLTIAFAILVVLSLGPLLCIGGDATRIVLPWALFLKLPLLSSALPGRFGLFVAFVAALMAALWISHSRPGNFWIRLCFGLLACIFLLPAPHVHEKLPASGFFRPGRVQAVLGLDTRILVLPFSINGDSVYWQAENNFGYRQTGGYFGFPPAAMQRYAAVGELFTRSWSDTLPADLKEFCYGTATQYVVAGPGTEPILMRTLQGFGWPSRQVDDVTIFTVPPAQEQAHG